jgi:hypothetical protein
MGLSLLLPELVGKGLEQLKQAVPGGSRVAILWQPGAVPERVERDILKDADSADTMKWLLLAVTLLIAPFAAVVSGGPKQWLLLEPPVDETSEFGRVLDEAPLPRWTRFGTFDNETACEFKRRESVEATLKEIVKLNKTSPLPSRDTFRGALRDRRLAEASNCVSADDPHLLQRPPR